MPSYTSEDSNANLTIGDWSKKAGYGYFSFFPAQNWWFLCSTMPYGKWNVRVFSRLNSRTANQNQDVSHDQDTSHSHIIAIWSVSGLSHSHSCSGDKLDTLQIAMIQIEPTLHEHQFSKHRSTVRAIHNSIWFERMQTCGAHTYKLESRHDQLGMELGEGSTNKTLLLQMWNNKLATYGIFTPDEFHYHWQVLLHQWHVWKDTDTYVSASIHIQND